MGVDAKMFLTTDEVIPDRALLSLSYRLCEAFGREPFWLDRDDGRHALSRAEEFWQDGPTVRPRDGETMIAVSLTDRLYCAGYERGPGHLHAAIAAWLEANVTGARMFYGGDSSGYCAEQFGPEERAALLAHFARVGHLPYAREWNVGSSESTDRMRRFCEFCQEPMSRYGWGRSGAEEYAHYTCLGCGDELTTQDGGATWTLLRDGKESPTKAERVTKSTPAQQSAGREG